MSEWLVLLSDGAAPPEGMRLLAQAGRVAVCEAPAEAGPPDGAINPDAPPPGLTDDESLFIESWRARPQAGAKERKGEGLPWDAPGFQPPDGPPRRKP